MAKPDDKGGKTGEGGDDGGDDTPKALTADDVVRIVNAAVTTHTKRLEGKLAEQIAGLVKTPEPKPGEGGAPDGGKGGDSEAVKALAKMESLLNAERKAREDERKEREAERAKAMRAEQSAALATALRDAGVTDKTMAKAAQALLESDGIVTRDESGAIKFRTVDKYGTEQFADLSDGLSSWVKTDGQAFMPPRRVAGSGSNPPKGGAPGSGKPDPKSEQIAEAREVFQSFIGGAE